MQVESHLQLYERSRWNSKNSSYELFLSFHVFQQVIVKWRAILVASWKPVLASMAIAFYLFEGHASKLPLRSPRFQIEK